MTTTKIAEGEDHSEKAPHSKLTLKERVQCYLNKVRFPTELFKNKTFTRSLLLGSAFLAGMGADYLLASFKPKVVCFKEKGEGQYADVESLVCQSSNNGVHINYSKIKLNDACLFNESSYTETIVATFDRGSVIVFRDVFDCSCEDYSDPNCFTLQEYAVLDDVLIFNAGMYEPTYRMGDEGDLEAFMLLKSQIMGVPRTYVTPEEADSLEVRMSASHRW